MRAIILTAGYGSRLMPLTKDRPKCLLNLNGEETILSRQLRILRSFGIEKIIIVVGHKKEKVISLYEQDEDIVFVHNSNFNTTGDAESLFLAREYFNDDFLVLNGDVVFTERLISDLLNKKESFVVSVEKKKCILDDVKVEIRNGFIVNVGKEIKLSNAFGEAVGVGKIQKEGIEPFIDAMNLSSFNVQPLTKAL